ncbi:MAG: carboxypeptidase-like regulatory domain-containing protein [Burkholderiales bacterium]|nr:carboxypeptidase-like regulatory domain-containing protein [Bacteroidia bacterium]
MAKTLHYYSFLLLSFFSLSSYAQNYTISGKVFDSESKEPLPFVPVLIKGTTVGGTTDFDGNYSITTDKLGDSIIASYVSYKKVSRAIKRGENQSVNLPMVLEGVNLLEVIVKAGENPAHRIIRNVIANKEFNNKRRLQAYQYETYNKVEFDLNRIPKEMRERKIFKPIKFVFDNVDSLNSGEKPSLPIFITEAISDMYYRSDPALKKEVIKASKVTGIENTSVTSVMGDMYQNINIYDNHLLIFNKDFVSPISDNAFFYYKFYLEDSLFIGSTRCYQIRFKSKRPQELCFSGNMWISDTTWAVKRLEMTIPKDANINFINAANIVQEFTQVDSTWMLSKDRLVIDFAMNKNQVGIYGRKTTSYKDFKINQPKDTKFYEFGDKIIVEDSAMKYTDAFWNTHRHDSLSVREKKIYHMIDTIKTLPVYKTWVDIFTIFVSGYKVVNNFEIGPYFNLVSYNRIEGTRVRFGGRTSSKFSRWYELQGYVAYGFKDEKYKYSLGFKSFISKKPHRQLIGMTYRSDYEILGQSQNGFSQDNIFASLFRTSPLTNLTRVDQTFAWYEREWIDGLTSKVTFVGRTITPLSTNVYTYYKKDGSIAVKENIKNTEVRLNVRFAYKEKFISGDFSRISLGTKWPVFQVTYAKSLQNAFRGEYDYQKVVLNIGDRIRLISLLGYTDYTAEVGKIFGAVPYPLMELHGGNETYVYDYMSFNMMKYYEFASDQYASVGLFHHFEGLIFNKIPYLKKLKWREVVTCKALWGSVNERNKRTLIFPNTLNALGSEPYVEVSAGIENIFKVFRVDALWRSTYLRPKAIDNFGVKFGFQLAF